MAVVAGVALLGTLAGCGGGSTPVDRTAPNHSEGSRADRPERRGGSEGVAPSSCEPDQPACRSAQGRIVYVERIDPDGDGDAHFVIADPQGITLPGFTAIDVRKGLRPQPLPGVGDLLSASGPVQTGSYGQSQIHALELHVADR